MGKTRRRVAKPVVRRAGQRNSELKLRFSEEILLLLLKEESGDLVVVPEPQLAHALAGAVLLDLAFEDRIDTDLDKLMLVSQEPLGDELLDPVLAQIAGDAGDAGARDTEYWLRRIAREADGLRETALTRLVSTGILESAEDGAMALTRSVRWSRRYPSADGKAEQEVRLRIMRVLFSDEVPDPRDVVIICLADACGLLPKILTKDDLAELEDRLDLVRSLDLIGRTVSRVAREIVDDASAAGPKSRAKRIPAVKGLPLLGSAVAANRDLSRFLAEQYQKLGPVFRLRLWHREMIVLAGPEANRFVHKQGKLVLRSHEAWQGFARELGLSKVLSGMDGNEHARFRRFNAMLYSRGRFEENIERAVAATREEIEQWAGRRLGAVRAMQRLVLSQLGTILTRRSPGPAADAFIFFFDALLATRLSGRRPMLLYSRRFKTAAKTVDDFLEQLIADHGPDGPLAGASDLVHDVLDLHREDPQLLPETDLKYVMIASYFYGLEATSVTCAYMLYALFRHPELMERVIGEADALFASGPPTANKLREMEVTHRVALETLRRYPVVSGLPRHVANTFEFAGYRIPAGATCLAATSVSHFLPELFADPVRFDIDRYLPPRSEHRQENAFVPFGVGSHRCLAAGFAEAQILLNFATIVHEAELAMDPPGYTLRTSSVPNTRPDKRFRFRLVRRRGVRPGPAGRRSSPEGAGNAP